LPSLHDPRDPELLGWLGSLPERQELIARLAVRGLCERCRGDRAWQARIEALKARHATSARAQRGRADGAGA